jgi:hypothetical protein
MIKITSSDSILQNWNNGSANPSPAASTHPVPSLVYLAINFPAGEVLEYKYINVASDQDGDLGE